MEMIVAIEQHLDGIVSALKGVGFALAFTAGILTYYVLFLCRPSRSGEKPRTPDLTPGSDQATFRMSN